MDTTEKILISFSLPLELKKRFAEICAQQNISVSQKIRQMMNQFVRENDEIKTTNCVALRSEPSLPVANEDWETLIELLESQINVIRNLSDAAQSCNT